MYDVWKSYYLYPIFHNESDDVCRYFFSLILNSVALVWAEEGDEISLEYAGTYALKGDLVRYGKQTFGGILKDGMSAVSRYYLNNFHDGIRRVHLPTIFIIQFMMDGRADAMAKTTHEKLMDEAKFFEEFQQKMIDYIKEVESEVERVGTKVERLGVGNTGCNFSKQYLEFRVHELSSTKHHLDIITNCLNQTRGQIATHHDYYVLPPTEEEEEEDSSSTCSKQH
ncbi:unnamed protein product [Prunus armeniaca]|uniref:Uncharacterized protein n=1 Tax=Prunus armeniaca TaxID=36596 RepID=A0A6J5XN17_PRUAR|nr:unnamed protein product [Prunus armeniaca]